MNNQNNITIAQLQEKKVALKTEINNLVKRFIEETGIEDIIITVELQQISTPDPAFANNHLVRSVVVTLINIFI